MPKPAMMHCIYRPKAGQEDALFALVKKHWPVLSRAGLVTATPAQVYRATDKRTGRPFFIEIFSWRDEQASGLAHQLPEVMSIWEPMGPMLEGGPSPELAHVEPVSVESN
jgi:hypothetical protein